MMTRLGEFLAKKSINKASVSRKTGIRESRLSALSNRTSTKLMANELYIIALAIDTSPVMLLEFVCGHLKVKADTKVDRRKKAHRGN
jgi:hypothetical protein